MKAERCVLPRRAEAARDALVSFIHDRHLKCGERVPTYAFFREKYGFGSASIASAVESLCAFGVLEVRDKVGVFVKDPSGGNLVGRNVAVVVRRLSGSAYAATLAGFLQKQLSESGCCCLTFYQQSDPMEVPMPGLEEFPGLEQAVREHRCDGVITLCPFSETAQKQLSDAGIHCCFIGDEGQTRQVPAVLIEVKAFLREAHLALKRAGCRRIVQFCISPEQAEVRTRPGLGALIGSSYDGGSRIASELLALPEEERPDGIVSDDDTIVSGFLATLVARQLPEIRYLPYIATIVHKELGELYPGNKVLLFEQDIERFASMAVEVLLDGIKGHKRERQVEKYRFQQQETTNNAFGEKS